MRTGQVVYTVALTLIVMLTILVLGFPYLANNPEDRQAILAIGSSAFGVLATLGSQAFFAKVEPKIEKRLDRSNGEP
jgi:hypothetical protein